MRTFSDEITPDDWYDEYKYPYFGQNKRPDGYKTASKIRKKDIDNYEYAGTCCDTYGKLGLIFRPKKN
ncbi:hypothetical protein ABVS18_004578 [Vibrio parahaemolyticus]